MSRRALVPAMLCLCSAFAFGCADESDPTLVNEEIIANLIQAGFPESDILVADGKVYVGRDAEVSLEASREMVAAPSSSEEQYRTTNLVSTSLSDICIDGSRFSGTNSSALDLAIENYNQLGLTFSMRRTGRNPSGCGAVIVARNSSGAGGSAGFPSGGRPYGTINIGRGTAQYGVDTVEHVITHELGHCVGFRHSDYYNRAISCGSGGNEGDGGVGAILIPGTPSTAVVGGSIMNSCFRASETGEFTSTDITALQTLY